MDVLNFISWIRGSRQVTNVNPTQTLLPVGLKDDRRDDGYLAGAITVSDLLALSPGGGLSGTNYIFVTADGTDVENAAELQAAYAEAISRTPSPTNRITIIAAPGYYNFDSTTFLMDTDYIDLVSLDGNRSIIFNSSNTAGTIDILANNILVRGVDVQTSKSFFIAGSQPDLKVTNCRGGDNSFGNNTAGTFIDCVAGNNSFGNDNAVGTFINCTAGSFSFGGSSSAIGIFTNCTAGGFSFGGGDSANGTFTSCMANDFSFGGGNSANGTFTNCIAGDFSFGGGNTASGVFINCQGNQFSFGSSFAVGTFRDCIGSYSSFGATNTASGVFTSCQSGADSFGFFGSLTGQLYYCKLTAGTFQTVSGAGVTRFCLDGSNVANNQG